MDVGATNTTDINLVTDPVGSRCQKLFQDFLEEWQEGEDLKYLKGKQLFDVITFVSQNDFDGLLVSNYHRSNKKNLCR